MKRLLGGAKRLLPKSKWGRLALVAGIVVVAAAVYGVKYYLDEVPVQVADDYRAHAEKEADQMTDAMDKVYASFDGYLEATTAPKSYFQNADDYEELRRRVLPILDETEDSLDRARATIKDADRRLKTTLPEIEDRPTKWMLDDSEPIAAIDEPIGDARAYARDSRRYLKSFERYIDYEEKMVGITRQSYAPRPIDDIGSDPSLETLKSAVATELEFVTNLREKLLDIDPHQEAERLHRIQVEQITVEVDYYEDFKAGLDNLSLPALEQADDDRLAAAKRLRGEYPRLFQEFSASSALQKDSRKLEKDGDALEESIAGLGSGDGRDEPGDKYRSGPPREPKDPAGSQESEKSAS